MCGWLTIALALQQNKISLVVVSEGPSNPLRAVEQVVGPRGTGCALELVGRSKLGSPPVPHQLGQRASKAKQSRYSRSIG